MNAAKYREVLEENLLLSARDLRVGHQFSFQHDNDPKHRAKKMLGWLWDKSETVLEWPSQSLDINLIEQEERPEDGSSQKLPIQSC